MGRKISDRFKDYLVPKMKYEGGKGAPDGGREIVKLSSNENPLGPSPKAMEAIARAITGLHRYPDQTDARLREALERFYDYRLEAAQFIGAPSGSEMIDLILRAFIRPGDEVILSNPSFLPYTVFAGWYDARVIDVPLSPEDYSLNVDGVLAAVTEKTRIVFLTSPNNPTGTYIPRKTLEELLDRLPDDVLVVFDEVYANFALAEDYTIALAYVEQGYPIIGLQSFSKLYGLAGIRLGYGYTTREIADYIRLICKPFILPQVAIAAGIAALDDREYVRQSVEIVTAGRDRMARLFDRLKIRQWPSQGNFILIDPPIPAPEFVETLMSLGIMVRPMDAFGAPGKVRISVGLERDIERLEEALETLVSRVSSR